MARERLKRLFPIALGLESAAVALSCSPSLLRDAIDAGELPAFENPKTGGKRILVEDLIEYVRTFWKRSTYRGTT